MRYGDSACKAVACGDVRPQLSSYLDRALTGRQLQEIEKHLAVCDGCRQQHMQLAQTQRMVSGLGRQPAPADLALRLRVAVSRESMEARRSPWVGLRVRWQNALKVFMVPATAGALSAVISFGLLIGFFALPAQLEAQYDVPTGLYTPPELKFSPFDMSVNLNGESIIVEAMIDASGRVQDYTVLSAPADVGEYLPQLKNMLIFTEFRPATSFGRPTAGKTVLSFSKIIVKG